MSKPKVICRRGFYEVVVPGHGRFRVDGAKNPVAAFSYIMGKLRAKNPKKPKFKAVSKWWVVRDSQPDGWGNVGFHIAQSVKPPAGWLSGPYQTRHQATSDNWPGKTRKSHNPRVEFKAGGRMHYHDTDPGAGVFVGPSVGRGLGRSLTAQGYSRGKPVASARARAFVVNTSSSGRKRNPPDSHKPGCRCFHHVRLRGRR